eukprot:m.56492 g.56492  ORF g.56492 m.56492 type:complete len:144 (+) comp7684_c0_seq1:78-509(+)
MPQCDGKSAMEVAVVYTVVIHSRRLGVSQLTTALVGHVPYISLSSRPVTQCVRVTPTSTFVVPTTVSRVDGAHESNKVSHKCLFQLRLAMPTYMVLVMINAYARIDHMMLRYGTTTENLPGSVSCSCWRVDECEVGGATYPPW